MITMSARAMHAQEASAIRFGVLHRCRISSLMVFVVLVLLGVETRPAFSEEEVEGQKNAVVMNLMFFPNLVLAGISTGEPVGSISVEYQRALGSGLVLTVAPEAVYLTTGIEYNKWNDDDFTGWGGGLLVGIRYLLKGEGLTGFYVSADGGAGWIDGGAGMYGLAASGNMFAFILDFGYMHTWSNGFTMGFGLGFSARWFVWHKESINTTVIAHPWSRLDIGFAW